MILSTVLIIGGTAAAAVAAGYGLERVARSEPVRRRLPAPEPPVHQWRPRIAQSCPVGPDRRIAGTRVAPAVKARLNGPLECDDPNTTVTLTFVAPGSWDDPAPRRIPVTAPPPVDTDPAGEPTQPVPTIQESIS